MYFQKWAACLLKQQMLAPPPSPTLPRGLDNPEELFNFLACQAQLSLSVPGAAASATCSLQIELRLCGSHGGVIQPEMALGESQSRWPRNAEELGDRWSVFFHA